MEREIKLLKEKIQNLSEENVALREINVQFQLENFKLQQRIKRLDNTQYDDSFLNERPGVSVVTFNDSTFDPTAEYLEDYPALQSSSKKVHAKNRQSQTRPSRASASKRNYADLCDDEEVPENGNKSLIKQELIISDDKPRSDDFIPDLEEQPDSEIDVLDDGDEIDPKTAATTIYKIAAKRGVLDRIKMLEAGKQKDSLFVNKTLELLFERTTLANSSSRGLQCQAKLHIPPRPALDRKKLTLCRQAFVYRLKREGLSYQAREERFKLFYSYVNFKIQNSRKLMRKKGRCE